MHPHMTIPQRAAALEKRDMNYDPELTENQPAGNGCAFSCLHHHPARYRGGHRAGQRNRWDSPAASC
ncbi:hypothetical protein NJLHNGOC_10940 [Novacetimonas cocois]|uniref:Uncharacterized protein n=1 Tax=Novacetimonas cocois TaxID=1747507 RepID=A0A365YTN2_9PROT|nr:hypothetical protein NJLHNGOC_10940 [Novacetimonas cocois]